MPSQEKPMKTSLSLLSATCLLSLLAGQAFADDYHSRLRRFDDLTFAAMSEARDLRWEIHDDFVGSRDYNHLLDEVNLLMDHLRDVQRAIYDERTPDVLDRTLDKSLARLQVVREDLLHSDFAQASGGSYHVTGRGSYSYTPATHHPGRVHVDAALRMLERVNVTLATLHTELVGPPLPVHPHGRGGFPVPLSAPAVIDPPSLPVPVSPTSLKLPKLKTKGGNIVFQLGN